MSGSNFQAGGARLTVAASEAPPTLATPHPLAAARSRRTAIREDVVVHANLGAGTVLVDLESAEPRALLLRRRKPPVGLWENPGGMLEPDEDFITCARRETLEETGLEAEPGYPWWARVEPWRGPTDHEMYAGTGFVARHPGGAVKLEKAAHDVTPLGHRRRVALSTKPGTRSRELDDPMVHQYPACPETEDTNEENIHYYEFVDAISVSSKGPR